MAKRRERTIVTCTEVVQIALMQEHVDNITALLADYDQILDDVLALSEEGYSINFMFNPEDKKFSVRLAAVTPGMPNEGKMLYGNGLTRQQAVVAIYIKHFLQSNGHNWVPTVTVTSGMS